MRFDVKGLAKDHYAVIKFGGSTVLLKVHDVNVEEDIVSFGSLTVSGDSLEVIDYSYEISEILEKYDVIELIAGDYMSLKLNSKLRILEVAKMIEDGARVMSLK